MARWQANVIILFMALIWGSAFVAQQTGVKEIPPLFFTGMRFLMGAAVVLPLMLWEQRRKAVPLTRRQWGWIAATGGCLYLGAHIQQLGIGLTSVTNAGFLTALYVPLVPLIGWAVWRDRPHGSVWIGCLLCLTGAYMMSGLMTGGGIGSLSFGDVLVTISAVFWALHVLMVGHVSRATATPFTLAFGQFFICAILGITGGVLLDSENLKWSGIWAGSGELLFVGLLSTGVAFTLQAVAQAHTKAHDAALIMSLEAVFATLAGMLILAERPDAVVLSGAALILAAVLIVQLIPAAARQSS